MSSDELLPCPFCGGKPHFYDWNVFPGTWVVRCDNHSCGVKPHFHVKGKEQAFAAWNTRQAALQGTGGEWQPIETAPDFAIFWVEPDLNNRNNDMKGMKAHACLQHRKWIPACWIPTLWQPAPLGPACKPTDSR